MLPFCLFIYRMLCQMFQEPKGKDLSGLEEVLLSKQLHGRLWIKSSGLSGVQENNFRLSLFCDNDS